jgi:hypothetical protein
MGNFANNCNGELDYCVLEDPPYCLHQWYSTWGRRTPGVMRRQIRGKTNLKKINIKQDPSYH